MCFLLFFCSKICKYEILVYITTTRVPYLYNKGSAGIFLKKNEEYFLF